VDETTREGGFFADTQSFEGERKNYASAGKIVPGSTGQAIGDTQKYEKVATVTELTADYEADRKRVDDLIAAQRGIVQFERATGLPGRRALYLGIGVPPDRFDSFIDIAKGIGRNIQVDIVKNDKTNEYLQLRAKRTTLDKARTGLEALQASGGSIDERMKVQNRLTEVEERMQVLGVSLGEFDSQNELCTVKLTLRETATVAHPLSQRFIASFEWTAIRYALLGGGSFLLVVGLWLAAALIRFAQSLARGTQAT